MFGRQSEPQPQPYHGMLIFTAWEIKDHPAIYSWLELTMNRHWGAADDKGIPVSWQ